MKPLGLSHAAVQIDSFRPDLEVPDLEVQKVDLQEIPAWESVFDGEGSQVAEELPRSSQQFPDWLSGQEVSFFQLLVYKAVCGCTVP